MDNGDKSVYTPTKTNMEPENHLFEKENHLQLVTAHVHFSRNGRVCFPSSDLAGIP